MTKTETKDTLSAEQTAVLQLVTIAPAPRTADELATGYAGQREANLWPEQSAEQIKHRIKELIEKGKLKEGDKAPYGEPTFELTAKAED